MTTTTTTTTTPCHAIVATCAGLAVGAVLMLTGTDAEASTASLNETDLVFDYLEFEYPQYWPPHAASYGQPGSRYRVYSNGQYLYEWNGELWYTINGSWHKNSSTVATWHSWIKNDLIDAHVTIAGIPFQSQLSASCSPNYLCGYASTNMLTAFLHGVTPTTQFMQDMAYAAQGDVCPNTLSSVTDYTYAAQTVGNAPDSYSGFLSYDSIKMLLTNDVPVNVSLRYSDLGDYRCSDSWTGGHQVVIVGYDEVYGNWTIHDPLCSTAQSGTYRTIPSSVFRAALTNHTDDHSGAWTVVVR